MSESIWFVFISNNFSRSQLCFLRSLCLFHPFVFCSNLPIPLWFSRFDPLTVRHFDIFHFENCPLRKSSIRWLHCNLHFSIKFRSVLKSSVCRILTRFIDSSDNRSIFGNHSETAKDRCVFLKSIYRTNSMVYHNKWLDSTNEPQSRNLFIFISLDFGFLFFD